MEPYGQYGEGMIVEENVVSEILSQPDAPVTILVYTRVENNTIKEIKRTWWYDDNAVNEYISRIIAQGFLYDDLHMAFSRRNPVGYPSSRESYQFIDRLLYENAKAQNGL